MIKALLLDADGVTIKQHRYFSEDYAEEHNVPLDKITPFFKEKFRACQKGQADLKEEIKPYLSEWNWQGSVEEFLNLWFTTETKPDNQILELVKQIRNMDIKCYLATDQEKYRAEYMNNTLGFNKHFDDTYYSCYVGHQKSEREFFERIVKNLNLNPDEIAYLDDDSENIEVAKQLGIQAQLFISMDDLRPYLSS